MNVWKKFSLQQAIELITRSTSFCMQARITLHREAAQKSLPAVPLKCSAIAKVLIMWVMENTLKMLQGR